MTALNYVLTDNEVILAMDTLVTKNFDKTPYKMATKFVPIPHMNCILCGTGNFEAIVDWFSFIQKNIVGNGIYQLNKLTQQALPKFMEEHNDNFSTTIYQFGLDEVEDIFKGYAYRSTSNFQSEELKKAIGIKPSDGFMDSGNINLSSYISENDTVDEILTKIMYKQKEYDENLKVEERVGIGGIIQIVNLRKNSFSINNYKYFDDYEQTYKEILAQLYN